MRFEAIKYNITYTICDDLKIIVHSKFFFFFWEGGGQTRELRTANVASCTTAGLFQE